MFEDEINGFIQELTLKEKYGDEVFPALLMIEDEGWDNTEDLKRILERMDVPICREEERGLILNISVKKDEQGKIHFLQGDKVFDFQHFYFVLRRNGLIRIDTVQVTH